MSVNFISESEVEEDRRRRQEEWDKVRTDEQPVECPEPEVELRSLYDRLKEQKDMKDEEFEEQHKFKNMIRGIDDGEAEFLEEISDRHQKIDLLRRKEEEDLIRECQEAVYSHIDNDAALTSNSSSRNQGKPGNSGASVGGKRRSQSSLILAAVKRRKSSGSESNLNKSQGSDGPVTQDNVGEFKMAPSALKVVGVIPGIGNYSRSSDSDSSAISDPEMESLLERSSSSKAH